MRLNEYGSMVEITVNEHTANFHWPRHSQKLLDLIKSLKDKDQKIQFSLMKNGQTFSSYAYIFQNDIKDMTYVSKTLNSKFKNFQASDED